MAAKWILFLISVILHQSYAPPPLRQPSTGPPVEVQQLQLDSGFTNTGDLYLTGGASLTHATYQNLDKNRRKVKRPLHPLDGIFPRISGLFQRGGSGDWWPNIPYVIFNRGQLGYDRTGAVQQVSRTLRNPVFYEHGDIVIHNYPAGAK